MQQNYFIIPYAAKILCHMQQNFLLEKRVKHSATPRVLHASLVFS